MSHFDRVLPIHTSIWHNYRITPSCFTATGYVSSFFVAQFCANPKQRLWLQFVLLCVVTSNRILAVENCQTSTPVTNLIRIQDSHHIKATIKIVIKLYKGLFYFIIMKYKWKRHITSTIKQYSDLGTVIFAVVSIALLFAYRYVENQELNKWDEHDLKMIIINSFWYLDMQ